MLLLHALLVFLLSISAMAAPVQGSDAKPPEPPEIKQIFHFYHGGIDTPFSLSYMKKLRGFWQTVVVSKHYLLLLPHANFTYYLIENREKENYNYCIPGS